MYALGMLPHPKFPGRKVSLALGGETFPCMAFREGSVEAKQFASRHQKEWAPNPGRWPFSGICEVDDNAFTTVFNQSSAKREGF